MAVRVQEQAFDIAAEIAALKASNHAIGAVVTFTGVVRAGPDAGGTETMTLEHYPGMTEAELERIEAEAHARWPLQVVTIIHRVGDLRPGDDIVLVATASAHRQAAFEAAQFVMDFLKTEAPFWKKETTQGGAAEWVDARHSDAIAADRWRDAAALAKD